MFCSQCEQTTRGQACQQWGACGKSPEVDALQDLLTHCLLAFRLKRSDSAKLSGAQTYY